MTWNLPTQAVSIPRMTDEKVIREYEANEAAALKLVRRVDETDHRAIAELTAKRLGLDYEDVRDVLVRHWAGQGAG